MFNTDDGHWYAFGLVPPAGVVRIDVTPNNVMRRQIGPGAVRSAWSNTTRDHRFSPIYQVVGRDPDFIALLVEDDLDLLLENLPATGVLRFHVIATKPAGDSLRSAVAEILLS